MLDSSSVMDKYQKTEKIGEGTYGTVYKVSLALVSRSAARRQSLISTFYFLHVFDCSKHSIALHQFLLIHPFM